MPSLCPHHFIDIGNMQNDELHAPLVVFDHLKVFNGLNTVLSQLELLER